MNFHAGPYAGTATQWTWPSPVSPLQILAFCRKIVQSTAPLNQPLARPPSLCSSRWQRWNKLCHMCWVFAIANHWASIIVLTQGDQIPLTTLEVLWKDSNRDLGRVEDLAHSPTINQTPLIILHHLSKAKVTLMRQTPLSLFQPSFLPPTTRNKLTGTLSDLLSVNNHGSQRDSS